MKTFFLLIVIIFANIISFGQSDSTFLNHKQFHSYYGIQVPDLTELNAVLGVNNYPKFNSNNFSIGFGNVKFTKKKIIIQQELFVYSQTQKNDTISSYIRSISIGQSLFGYSYIFNENIQMYSLFGLSYFNTTLKVSKEIASSTQFNYYASAIGNQLEMTSNSFAANLTTHFNYALKIPNSKNRLILGLRAAYYFPIEALKWTMNKTKLDNGPNINPGGYAVNFVLGFSY